MSKKEILQSLSYQQYQDTVMLNRFLITLARTLNVDPEVFAKNFVDQAGNAEFANKINAAIDTLAAAEQSAQVDAPAQEASETVSE